MSANREWFHKNPTNRKRPIIRRLIPAVMACLLAVVTPVCGRAETSNIVVEDFRGKKLVFSKPVERVVCLLDSALTGLYMLNAEDRVVGVSLGAYTGSSARYYAAMDPRLRDKSLPVVSNSLAGSLERIIALEPDLVIVWTLSRETIDVLEERGIAVFGVFIDDLDDIYREVLALGRMTGTDDRAEHLVNYTKKQIAGVREKTAVAAEASRPRAYFMWAKGELDSGGRPSIVQELLDIAGAVNICGHIDQEHVVINQENLLAADPRVLIMWYNPLLDPAEVMKKPVFRNLSAAKNNRVHELPGLFTCDLCTLNFQYSASLLAAWCHPEIIGRREITAGALETFRLLYGDKLPVNLIREGLCRGGKE